MKPRVRHLVSAALFFTTSVIPCPARGDATLRVRTNVAIAATGGTVAVVVSVAPDGRNRLLTIQAESGTYLRSSAVQLDGHNEAVTQQFWFKGVPDGEYLISGRLEGAEGSVLATACTQLRVGSDYVRRERPPGSWHNWAFRQSQSAAPVRPASEVHRRP